MCGKGSAFRAVRFNFSETDLRVDDEKEKVVERKAGFETLEDGGEGEEMKIDEMKPSW